MKTHTMTKLGFIGTIIVGATVLPHTDELAANTASVGNFFQQMACVVGDVSGGIVEMPVCEDIATKPATAPASSDQD